MKTYKEASMNKLISLAILAVGIVLVIYGVSASKSFSSDVSRFFTGSPTDKTIWLLIGGIVAIIIGLFGLLRGQTK
jgi:capsule polysaccharide export protein KpsE/RkpR